MVTDVAGRGRGWHPTPATPPLRTLLSSFPRRLESSGHRPSIICTADDYWVPACAGTTVASVRLGAVRLYTWVPAFAGMSGALDMRSHSRGRLRSELSSPSKSFLQQKAEGAAGARSSAVRVVRKGRSSEPPP